MVGRSQANRARMRAFHEEDGGMSTVGMVLAMLITLSLIFSSAQVYKLQSAAANVQNVADAAALAAENQVASFYIVAQVCDAIVLTMSLTGICSAGLGVACLCTPATVGLSEYFLGAAKKIFQAREDFAGNAAEALNKLQTLLPFIAAAQAYSVAQANAGNEGGYYALAVLLPFEGEEITVSSLDEAEEILEEIDGESEGIIDAAAQAEEAAEAAEESKETAFMADCGNNPDYCMYQRAKTLAGLTGTDNPLYTSVDAWSFSVALKRAKAYYAARLEQEEPEGSSVKEQANSALRTRFFQYACDMMEEAYVTEDEDAGTFDACFPLLPKNTSEMRETVLYTEEVYPITVDDLGVKTMHAWSGCPEVESSGSTGLGSVSQMESGDFSTCEECCFTAASLGKVAAASSSIENGFEYHYRIVAEQAEVYEEARAALAPLQAEVKESAGGLFELLESLLEQVAGSRIEVSPPGHYGAVAIVASTDGVSVSSLFPSGFVSGSGTLGTRAAVSAATMARDDADEAESTISSLLDGFAEESGGVGGVSIVLNLWSALLEAYANGQDALSEGIAAALDKIPFTSKSGLGTWASQTLEGLVEAAGLEPADIYAYKPVLVNSAHVLAADSSDFSSALLQVKLEYTGLAASGSPLALLSSIAGIYAADSTVEGADMLIATIELLGDESASIPFSIALPEAAAETGESTIAEVISQLRSIADSVAGGKDWQ